MDLTSSNIECDMNCSFEAKCNLSLFETKYNLDGSFEPEYDLNGSFEAGTYQKSVSAPALRSSVTYLILLRSSLKSLLALSRVN